MTIKIITDSTCNLPAGFAAAHDVRFVPISIQFGQETFQEGIDITRQEFFARIDAERIIPTTSQPPAGTFAEVYRQLVREGNQGLVVTITSLRSGVYQSAVIAKDLVPEADVAVVDSLSVAYGTGFLVMDAVRLAEAGKKREEIVRAIEALRPVPGYLTPATLRYLQMSGRIGKLQGALASLLNIKAVISIHDGILDLEERVRTRSKALERVLERVAAAAGDKPMRFAVLHVAVPDEAAAFAARVRQRLNCVELYMDELSCSLAVHGGPGIIGLEWCQPGEAA